MLKPQETPGLPFIFGLLQRISLRAAAPVMRLSDPPPLNWSTLKYVLRLTSHEPTLGSNTASKRKAVVFGRTTLVESV